MNDQATEDLITAYVELVKALGRAGVITVTQLGGTLQNLSKDTATAGGAAGAHGRPLLSVIAKKLMS